MNKISGKGKFIWKNGDEYIGEVKNGILEGEGEYHCRKNGGKYKGLWKDGKREGLG